jgi:hypothetical protein
MHKIAKQSMVLFVILVLVFIPFGASVMAVERHQNEDPGAGDMMFDLLVLRPMGFVGVVTGPIVFVVSLPFSAAGGNIEQAADQLVFKPALWTFYRPLGGF